MHVGKGYLVGRIPDLLPGSEASSGRGRRAQTGDPPRDPKGDGRREKAEAEEESDEVSGRGPLELRERLVEVADNERAGGPETVSLVADRPAGRMHGRENAMGRLQRRQAIRSTRVGIPADVRRESSTCVPERAQQETERCSVADRDAAHDEIETGLLQVRKVEATSTVTSAKPDEGRIQ